ncbi:unnamed protein product (macronuclear) [Paramecium tetraurelia]|uniref:Transmembrane protein 198 n=1 Tax=Paramecium tetraurelia TaxID=5888 RepID=A0BM16_PARTE|nr:uncharacterized protein GSPATT00030217001 [Paramecium tetraurelia]CAK59583.1 unnamed protein product [Paramecium tetraurelia]|eukprot:XP_001426981.1 hypothetical protein (macronuclear) [Paramecium tetraurelia strain d4-2]
MMKFFIVSILFTTLLSCQVYYNSDIRFDFSNAQANNLAYGNDGKSLFITLCGLLNYKCEKSKSTRILEETKSDSSNTPTTNTETTNTNTSTNENKTNTDTVIDKNQDGNIDKSDTTTSTDTNTPAIDDQKSESQVIENKTNDEKNDKDDDANELKYVNNDKTQSLIVAQKNTCTPYSEQSNVDPNQLTLLVENKPFQGLVIERRGIVEKETFKLKLKCSESDVMTIEDTDKDGYLFILTTSSACPILVYNPITQFFMDFKLLFVVILWVVGIFLLLLGYQLAQLSSMILAVLMGFGFTTIVIGEATLNSDSSYAATWVVVGSGVLVAFIYFNASMQRFFFLLFNFGFSVGVILSLMIQSLFYYSIETDLMFFPLTISIIVSGGILGLLGLRYNLQMGIVSTSLVGAYCLIRPIGFLAGGYPNELLLTKKAEYGFDIDIEYSVYAYNAVIILVAIFFGIFQRRQHLKRVALDDQLQADIRYYEMGNVEDEEKQKRQSKNSDKNVTVIFAKHLENQGEELQDKKRHSHLTGSDIND